MEKEFDIDVTWKGFEIHPQLPVGGLSRDMLFRGSSFRQVEESLKRLADEAGLTLKSPRTIANTRMALEAAEFAREHGAFAELHRRLFEAYFQEGANISEIEVLIKLANDIGMDGVELRQALAERRYREKLEETTDDAHRCGVSGTPTFFIGDRCVVGAQPYENLRQASIRAGARPRAEREDR